MPLLDVSRQKPRSAGRYPVTADAESADTEGDMNVYRYLFNEETPMDEVQDLLVLAILSAEGLHGQAQVRLDAGYSIDRNRHACVVDGATPVGHSVAQIFTGLITRQLGEGAYRVERVGEPSAPSPARENGATR